MLKEDDGWSLGKPASRQRDDDDQFVMFCLNEWIFVGHGRYLAKWEMGCGSEIAG